ncbi:MAG TPA: 2-oxoacid:acceptor oxidoreductase subunit alpha [Anaerolineales bacterium]
MSETVTAPTVAAAQAAGRADIVNDFSMVVATVNGSGSQTSNLAIIRAMFRMGIPVSGKNLFPSNIQGLPTWYTIRANSAGHTARREKVEILVAMNQATVAEDLAGLESGGVCFFDDSLAMPPRREDVTYYPMPIKDLLKQTDPPRELKDYVANMGYVGVVSQMLGIELEEIAKALDTHFGGRAKAIQLNMGMIQAAFEWAGQNLEKSDPYQLRRDDQTEGKILIEGSTAAALGAIYGGLSFASWYPITPASSLADAINEYMPRLRKDPEDGKHTYVVLQAEDELAAVGMAIGAGWAGARSMTSTSGPGISLMAEFAGLAFFAEVPVVIWDVQRMGPSTGLPTRTSQGDILFVRFLGHGDTRQVMLLPGSVAECFEFGWRAFDLAERLQTPIFVLSDLDLGMNLWMSDPFEYPQQPLDRGKVLSEQELERIGEFARYKDVDGDGIPYRTIPGNRHRLAAWFARGTGHNEQAVYSERSDDWEGNMARLMHKHETAREHLPRPIVDDANGARVGLIAYGSTDPAVQEARARLAQEGFTVDYLRLRAVPFSPEVSDFIRAHEVCYVIEMNTDGQMHKLLQLEAPELATRLRSLARNNGLPLSARWIAESLQAAEEA